MPEFTVMTNASPYSVPSWQTTDYVQDKLRKRNNESNLHITDINFQPALSKGSNFCSEMTRIKVSYRLGNDPKVFSESLIIKSTLPDYGEGADILNQYDFYKREMIMYERVLPRLQDLLNKIGKVDRICAKTVYVDYDNNSIVFEDLKESGFTMADRVGRLDMEHSKLALKKLAEFHAAAAVLHEKFPELFAQNFDRGLFNRHTQGFSPAIFGVLDSLTRYVGKQPELKEPYYEKLLSLRDRHMEYSERAFDVNSEHFMTLIHGDFWHTNMMFKYSAEEPKKPIEVVPLDYQASVWASPAVDLHYFFNIAIQDDLRMHEQAKLVKYYYENLVGTLKKLKYNGKVPSLFEFRMQFEARNYFAIQAALIMQSFMIYNNPDSDMAILYSPNEDGIRFRDSLFDNPVVQANVRQLLPVFDQKGLLDDMDSFYLQAKT